MADLNKLRFECFQDAIPHLVYLWNRHNAKIPHPSQREVFPGAGTVISASDLLNLSPNGEEVQTLLHKIGEIPESIVIPAGHTQVYKAYYVHSEDDGSVSVSDYTDVLNLRRNSPYWLHRVIGLKPNLYPKLQKNVFTRTAVEVPAEDRLNFASREVAEYLQWCDNMLDLMRVYVPCDAYIPTKLYEYQLYEFSQEATPQTPSDYCVTTWDVTGGWNYFSYPNDERHPLVRTLDMTIDVALPLILDANFTSEPLILTADWYVRRLDFEKNTSTQLFSSFTGHTCFDVGSQGRTLIIGGSNGKVNWYNKVGDLLDSWTSISGSSETITDILFCTEVVENHPAEVCPIADSFLISQGNNAYLCSLRDGSVLTTFSGHTGTVNGVYLYTKKTGDEYTQKLYTWSNDTTIKEWSLSGTLLNTYTHHSYPVTKFDFRYSGDSAGNVYDLSGLHLLSYSSEVTSISYSLKAAGFADGTVQLLSSDVPLFPSIGVNFGHPVIYLNTGCCMLPPLHAKVSSNFGRPGVFSWHDAYASNTTDGLSPTDQRRGHSLAMGAAQGCHYLFEGDLEIDYQYNASPGPPACVLYSDAERNTDDVYNYGWYLSISLGCSPTGYTQGNTAYVDYQTWDFDTIPMDVGLDVLDLSYNAGTLIKTVWPYITLQRNALYTNFLQFSIEHFTTGYAPAYVGETPTPNPVRVLTSTSWPVVGASFSDASLEVTNSAPSATLPFKLNGNGLIDGFAYAKLGHPIPFISMEAY